MSVTESLQKHLIRSRLKVPEIAERLGVAAPTARKWFNGGYPRIDQAIALAEIFGVSLAELLGINEQSPVHEGLDPGEQAILDAFHDLKLKPFEAIKRLQSARVIHTDGEVDVPDEPIQPKRSPRRDVGSV